MSSRSSSASAPSSAASSGSSRIDLGKDSGVDMGRKSQTSASSGGIGITQEITTIGGLQIEGGVSVDVSPLDLEVSSNGKDRISIGASAEIPGGLLGVGGGVTIDTNTGQVKGGSVSGEVAGFGVEISKTEEGFGLGISFQIPGTPISINLGFGEKPPATPTPTPAPTPTPTPTPGVEGDTPGDKQCKGGKYTFVGEAFYYEEARQGWWVVSFNEAIATFVKNQTRFYDESKDIKRANETWGAGKWKTIERQEPIDRVGIGQWQWQGDNSAPAVPRLGSLFSYSDAWNLTRYYYLYVPAWFDIDNPSNPWPYAFSSWISRVELKRTVLKPAPACPLGEVLPPPLPPNPPPRKEMDECCRESMKMLRNLSTVMQVENVLKGKYQIPGELIAIPEEGKALPPEILQTYPQMVNAILLAVNRHGMDAPIIVEIEDTDKTTAGDQSAVYTYNSPGVAMQAVLEMLHELKAAGNARLSIQIGTAFAATRILKIVAGVSESIREIIKMLGMPFRYKPKKMQLEFNLAGIKKGYGKDSKSKEFSEMSKEELENIIPTLLEGSECDIPVPTFTSSEADDIRQMLCKLTIKNGK